MSCRVAVLPVKRIALYGFVLNAIWEFGQCYVFYDMWDWSFWQGTSWMWGAVAGDVLIVLAVTLLAGLIVGPSRLTPPDLKGWTALLGIGFLASVWLEWLARTLKLWSYSALMPTLEVFGYTVGLSPVVQVTVPPALSVYLAIRG
jgi:hypothetical protein